MLVCFGGLSAMFMGWYLKSSVKRLPDGSRRHHYSARDREGSIMMTFGVISLMAWLGGYVVALA
jgi:hypothetical protein